MERLSTDPVASWFELDARKSTLHSWGARRSAVLVLAFSMLFAGLRSVHLDADPTTAFGSRATRELVAEPAAKSHEARNYALFSTYHVNKADDYQFWRAQSPVWVYPLTAFFRMFGVDWPQLRLFSTLYAALGFAAVLAIAVRFLSPWAVAFVGALVAIDGVYFHYARAGLLEPAVNTWLAACMLALILAQHRATWLIVAHWTLALAFFTKQAALVAVPVVLLASAYVLARSSARERAWVAANLVLVISLAALYIANSDYQRAAEHNVNHVLMGSDAPENLKYRGVGSMFKRIVADGRYKHFLRTVPVSGSLAIVASAWLAFVAWRTRRLAYAPAVITGWFVCSIGAMLVVAWSALRFWTLVVLPAALLAGFAFDALLGFVRKLSAARLLTRLLAVGACAALIAQARHLYEPLFAPSYTLRDSALAIRHAIGPHDATVIGARSPPMVLGTPYKNYYVRALFNSSREQLLSLAPTHFLFLAAGDGSQTIVTNELPEVVQALVPLAKLTVRGDDLVLYARDQRVTNLSAPGGSR